LSDGDGDSTATEVLYAVLVALLVLGFVVLGVGLATGSVELRVGGTVLVAVVLFSSPSGAQE